VGVHFVTAKPLLLLFIMNVSQISLLITSRRHCMTSYSYRVCYLYCQIDYVLAAVQYVCKC